ncbi:hypothetical protein BJ742DRAFT_854775, partial [Cladochytrium replicatum]
MLEEESCTRTRSSGNSLFSLTGSQERYLNTQEQSGYSSSSSVEERFSIEHIDGEITYSKRLGVESKTNEFNFRIFVLLHLCFGYRINLTAPP